jgi:galactonate dehydratase
VKVKKLTAYLTSSLLAPSGWMTVKPFLFVRLETDSGVCGWGECYTLAHRQHAMMVLLEVLADEIIGQSVYDVDGFLTRAIDGVAEKRPGIDLYCVVSGIETAMWDVQAKHAGQPLYELLGGDATTRLPLYLNLWSDLGQSLQAVCQKAETAVASGFGAVKMYPFKVATELAGAAHAVRELRQSLGADIELLIDCGRALDECSALEFSRRLEGLDVYWLEEPVTSRDAVALRDINAGSSLRLVSGESVCGCEEFRTILEMTGIEILNPDVAVCGGVKEFQAIATMASSYDAVVSPHNYNSMITGLGASCHLASTMNNCLLLEYFDDHADAGNVYGECEIRIDSGHAVLGRSPGLGVSFDEIKLRSVSTEVLEK